MDAPGQYSGNSNTRRINPVKKDNDVKTSKNNTITNNNTNNNENQKKTNNMFTNISGTNEKGNDGRGARTKLIRKLFYVINGCLCFAVTFPFICFVNHFPISSPSSSLSLWQFMEDYDWISSDDYIDYVRSNNNNNKDAKMEFKRRRKVEPKIAPGSTMLSLDNPRDEPMIQQILNANFNLVDISVANFKRLKSAPSQSYDGLIGKFCKVNFDLHKQNPAEVPMFRDLASRSGCDDQHYYIDLKAISSVAREYDKKIKDSDMVPKVLQFGGIAFHESRCGSTLVANSLIAMNPTKHRVYSESPPPVFAMKNVCGEEFNRCSEQQAANLLRDVIYLMSRSNQPEETHVFFKMQSISTRYMHIFRNAFPQIPWIFVYRDPVQVMMSHLKGYLATGEKRANCLRALKYPPPIMDKIAQKHLGARNTKQLSVYEFCATHLASLTETAARNVYESHGMGIPVNYQDLPQILYEQVLPEHFHISVDAQSIENIQKISGTYSKARDRSANTWQGDNEKKEQMANEDVRKAADLVMGPSYKQLQRLGLQTSQKRRNK